jgi:hypothetical protein
MKKETKLLVRLRRTDREKRDFESLNEVTSLSCCLGALSMTQVMESQQWSSSHGNFVLPKF